MEKDKLMRYAELIEAGNTEEADKLIGSDSNLAEVIGVWQGFLPRTAILARKTS
jgi:hypothetical protein